VDLESKYFNSQGNLHDLPEANKFMPSRKGIVNPSSRKAIAGRLGGSVG